MASTSPTDQLAGRLVQAGRSAWNWYLVRNLAWRLGLPAVALSLPLCLLAWAWGHQEPETVWISVTEKVRPVDLESTRLALGEAQIVTQVGRGGQILVTQVDHLAALKVLREQGLIPQSTRDVLEQKPSGLFNPFSASGREQQWVRRTSALLSSVLREAGIAELRDVRVLVVRGDRRHLDGTIDLHADVQVTTHGDLMLSQKAQRQIVQRLMHHLPGLQESGILLADHHGTTYLPTPDPGLTDLRRSERLKHRIVKELAWIDGQVHVQVTMSPQTMDPTSEPASSRSRVVMRINGQPGEQVGSRDDASQPTDKGETLIHVRIPGSHSRREFRARGETRDPNSEQIAELRRSTIEVVRHSIELLTRDLSQVEIYVGFYPDPEENLVTVGSADPKSTWNRWQVVTLIAGGLAVATLIVIGLFKRSSRPPSRSWTHYPQRADSPHEGVSPGPAARRGHKTTGGRLDQVREIARRDRDVAAGILTHWIGQGGSLG